MSVEEESLNGDIQKTMDNENGHKPKHSMPAENTLFEPKHPALFKGKSAIIPHCSSLAEQRHKAFIGLIKAKTKRYKEVFKRDLEEQYQMSKEALSGVRIARCFVIGIDIPKRFPDPLTPKQRERVEDILKYNVS